MARLTIAQVLDDLRGFLDSLARRADLSVTLDRRRRASPASPTQLRRLHDLWGHKLPDDITQYLRTDRRNFVIEAPGEVFSRVSFASAADLASPARTGLHSTFESEARNFDPDPESYSGNRRLRERDRLFRDGVPLMLVVDDHPIVWDSVDGTIRQTASEPGEVPTEAIADSLSEFLTHFVAAGCFRSGDRASSATFKTYWPRVRDLVPIEIPPKQNLWLAHLDRFYAAPSRPRPAMLATPPRRSRYFEGSRRDMVTFVDVFILQRPEDKRYFVVHVSGDVRIGDTKVRVRNGTTDGCATVKEAEALLERTANKLGKGMVRVVAPGQRRVRGYPYDWYVDDFELDVPIEQPRDVRPQRRAR